MRSASLALFFLFQLVSGAFAFTSISLKGLPAQTRVRTGLNFSKNNSPSPDDSEEKTKMPLGKQLGRSLFISSSLALVTNLGLAVAAPPGFKRIPTQFIAALPAVPTDTTKIKSGDNAATWGLWEKDPGPRGVFLKDFEKSLKSRNNVAPVGWKFDPNDWWLEEHGLIMESPKFPLEAGRYLVTGGRLVTTVLTVEPDGKWKLDNGSLYDVTHLPCRSARYTPAGDSSVVGGPLTANQKDFPVTPGAEMPKVNGCEKVDYSVLFVIGKEA